MICERSKCTACGLCKNICPRDCIEMRIGEDGFIECCIDESKCIHCDQCVKMCPQNGEIQKSNAVPTVSYCAQTLNEQDLRKSSSGGMFLAFAKFFIEERNGVVYASRMNEELKVAFSRFDMVEELLQAQGSRYVQSFVNDTYRNVKKDLDENRAVMFIGCPCQVYALKMYLKKDYENLLTVDLVCHGIGSYRLYFKNLERYRRKGNDITEVKFRSKEKFTFTNHYIMTFTYRDGKKSYVSALNDEYMSAYFHKAIYRESCYTCGFTGFPRIGDLTVGDFAGVDIGAIGKKRYCKGVSVLLVNNEHGKTCLDALKDRIWYTERPLREATDTNENILRPCKRPKERDMLNDHTVSDGQVLKSMRYSIKNKIGICLAPYLKRLKKLQQK